MSGGRPIRPPPSLLFRRVRALALLVALVLVATAGVQLVKRSGWERSPRRSSSTGTEATEPAPPTSEAAAAALAQSAADRNAKVPGRMLIVVGDLDTGVSARTAPGRRSSGPAW